MLTSARQPMVHAPIDISHGFEDGLSARALLSSIRRHWVLVSTLSLLLCAVGAVVGLGLPSWFQAETVLIINARPQRIADVQEQPDPIPDRAAAIVNAHIESYQNLQEKIKLKAAKRANAALTAEISQLKKQLQAAE